MRTRRGAADRSPSRTPRAEGRAGRRSPHPRARQGLRQIRLRARSPRGPASRSEEHTSELQSLRHLVCRLLLEKKKKTPNALRRISRSLPKRQKCLTIKTERVVLRGAASYDTYFIRLMRLTFAQRSGDGRSYSY